MQRQIGNFKVQGNIGSKEAAELAATSKLTASSKLGGILKARGNFNVWENIASRYKGTPTPAATLKLEPTSAIPMVSVHRQAQSPRRHQQYRVTTAAQNIVTAAAQKHSGNIGINGKLVTVMMHRYSPSRLYMYYLPRCIKRNLFPPRAR